MASDRFSPLSDFVRGTEDSSHDCFVPVVTLGDSNGATSAAVDAAIGVVKTEQRFSTTVLTASGVVKSGIGMVHTITIAPNAALPTAGTIDVYDNTTGSGTKIFSVYVTNAYFAPVTITLDAAFSTGLYVAYGTTNSVNVIASYR